MKREIVAAIFVIACGGGLGGGSASLLVQRSAEQTCAKAFSCMSSFPPDAGFEFSALFGANQAQCEVTFTNLLEPEAVQASVQSGRILFDANDAEVCLAAAEALTCDQFWAGITGETAPPEPAECETAFIGTVGLGETCTIDQDCADGICDDRTLTCV